MKAKIKTINHRKSRIENKSNIIETNTNILAITVYVNFVAKRHIL